MTWTSLHTELRKILTSLVEDPDRIRRITRDIIGFNINGINFRNNSENIWQEVIEQAIAQEYMTEFFQIVQPEFPRNTRLPELYKQFLAGQHIQRQQEPFLLLQPIPRDNDLETIMGSVPTFLPIAFLEAGWIASKSVVRVVTNNFMGTGFLIKPDLMITNNHVLPSKDVADRSVVYFDYQSNIDGKYVSHTQCFLDTNIFYTDPNIDLSIVKVILPDSFSREPLTLSDEPVRRNDRVSIIQHPEGARKQVALHRNFVLYADNNVLQYMTDTLPGSSGSPIFDIRWHVVGVHSRGGSSHQVGRNQIVYGNQGISLEQLRNFLSRHNILNN